LGVGLAFASAIIMSAVTHAVLFRFIRRADHQ
jgi:hypothetical protein